LVDCHLPPPIPLPVTAAAAPMIADNEHPVVVLLLTPLEISQTTVLNVSSVHSNVSSNASSPQAHPKLPVKSSTGCTHALGVINESSTMRMAMLAEALKVKDTH
jgi:hypothetical protein